MSEIRGAASMARKGRMPFMTVEKSEVLRKLQGRIYFEKSLSASSVSCPDTALVTCMEAPADLVHLRSDVKFSAGWKRFATSNGLSVGDSLVFSVTAMSEFEIYIFPQRCPPQLAPREWSDGSVPSRKRTKQAYENKDEQLADEEGIEVTVKTNGVFPKKKTVGAERVVSASSRNSMPCSLSSNSEVLHHPESESIRFEKTLSLSNVSKRGKSTMALPTWFVKKHGDKFQKSVILRSESSTKEWDVNLTIECRTLASTQVKFSGGWKAFVAFHGLLVGDLLVFSLTAMSEFEVSILPGARMQHE